MSAPRDWQDMTHAELDAAVHSGAGPGASMPAEAMWRELARVITDAEVRMHAAANRSAEGWEGGGADAARSGLHSLNSWVLGATTDAQITLSTMVDQGVASGRLRSAMPDPITERLAAAREAGDVNLFDEGIQRGVLAAEEEARWRAESARRAMETYYYISLENRRTIDFWSVPPTVVVEAVTWSGSGSGAGPGGLGPLGGGPADLRASGAEPPASGGTGPAGSALPGAPPSEADGAGSGLGTLQGGPAVAGAPLVASAPVVGGGPGVDGSPSPSGAGTGGPVGAGGGGGGPTTASGAVPVTGPASRATPGRDALPPGAGGRGVRAPSGNSPAPGSGWAGTGPRAVLPGVPLVGSPAPTWRDLVSGPRGGAGGSGGGPSDPPAAPRTGAVPRPDVRTVVASTPVTDTGRGAAGHGLYPPMGAGTGGGQGEGRRRAPFLVDDSGAFEVHVPYTDPVIGAVDCTEGGADRGRP